jgi:hypothetical protein
MEVYWVRSDLLLSVIRWVEIGNHGTYENRHLG